MPRPLSRISIWTPGPSDLGATDLNRIYFLLDTSRNIPTNTCHGFYDRATNTYLRTVSVEGKQFDNGTKPKVRIAPTNVVSS